MSNFQLTSVGLLLNFTLLCLLFLFTSCHSINEKFGLKDDNMIEEAIEKLIENKTGFDIDLTPDSPESK